MSAFNQETRNEELERRAIEEVGNQRNVALIDELFSPNLVVHAMWHEPHMPQALEAMPEVEGMKAFLAQDHPDYENLHTSIDQMISGGDKVVVVTTTTGTRNGRQISWTSVGIDRFEGGRIAETWLLWDRLGMYQQLGVVPPTPELVKKAGLQLFKQADPDQ